jgi:hypothetical protein
LTLNEAKVRHVISSRFFVDEIETWSLLDQADLGRCLARLGFPWNLNTIEMGMFEKYPRHPLFTPMSAVNLPKGLTAEGLARNHEAFFVIDVVRSDRLRNKLTQRPRFSELRAILENSLEESFDALPFGQDGHLISSILPRTGLHHAAVAALVEQPLHELVATQIHDRYLSRAYDHAVMIDLNKLTIARGDRGTSEMPARYYMTAGFHKLIRHWTQDRRRQFHNLMVRLNLPINLEHDEMDQFVNDPQDRMFAVMSSVPELAGFVTKKSQVHFVIDAVKALQGIRSHPFKDDQPETKRTALEKYLGRSIGNRQPWIGSALSSPSPIAAGLSPNEVDCQIFLRDVSDEDFAQEYNRRMGEGRFRLIAVKPKS